MIVMKFGGSSLASRANVEQVARIVAGHAPSVVVVVSAIGDTTDHLLETAALAERGDFAAMQVVLDELARAHRELLIDENAEAVINRHFAELTGVLQGVRLLREQTARSRALVASIGERLSSVLVAAHLQHLGHPARAVDARTFMVTDEQYLSAEVQLEPTQRLAEAVLRPVLAEGAIPVVTGFIGATEAGITTTLGRGGSDYTAALVGSLLRAREIWIWTDVNGILTADPRLVREARTLEQVSYREAAEMSYFGAKVLHPKTIGPAVVAGIPIRVKNTFNSQHPGTLVAASSPVLRRGVKTVSSIHDLALVTIEGRGMAGVPGVARRVFQATEDARVSVVMISQASSEQTISFVVPKADVTRLVASLEQQFALELRAGAIDRIVVDPEIAITSIVGEGMAGTPGISGKLFGALGAVDVNVLAIAQGASELSISVAVREPQARRAVQAIHSAFGLTRVINLVVMGCGRVGRTFLRQLQETRSRLEQELGVELRLTGLANSQHLLLDDGGLNPSQATEALRHAGPRPAATELIAQLEQLHLTDAVLVDLTAAETGELLRAALHAGIHVVTANKRPLSSSWQLFHELFAAARSTGARLHYETTFGAGLPVLHTLQELLLTGDRFFSISGCFSGTLGYICTQLEHRVALAEAVRGAEQAGLTEPDPRDDLSGRDVARKALIIARTMGLELEPEQIALEPLVPHLEQGLEPALQAYAPRLAAAVEQAMREGQTLRYLAEVTPDGMRVGLRAVPLGSPLGSLQGQDNMLVYRTERYDEFPLVIRGPGAGTEVTAAGVLGDVLKIARGVSR